MKRIILSLLITVMLWPYSYAQEARGEILFDFIRTDPSYDGPIISAQQTHRILRAALGARYKSRAPNPSISQMLAGAFTAPQVSEVAYIIRGSSSKQGSTIDMQNDSRLVIFSGNRLVVNIPFYGFSILRTSDLNKDGVDELLLHGGWFWMGETATTAELVEVKGRKLRVIRDFEQVESAYMCEAGQDVEGQRNISAIIYYTPSVIGKPPRFRVDFYKGECPDEDGKENPETFRYVQSGKMPE